MKITPREKSRVSLALLSLRKNGGLSLSEGRRARRLQPRALCSMDLEKRKTACCLNAFK